MDRVGVGEDVVGRLPVAVLIGIPKARKAKSCPISQGPAKVSGTGASADRCLERVNDLRGIVTEQLPGKHRMLRPATHASASSELFR